MKRKSVVFGVITIIVIIAIASIIINSTFEKEIWDINAEKLKNSISSISVPVVIEDLSTVTPFEWDTLYSFEPYLPKENIYETVGYKWDSINETVSEGMTQIVFMKDNKVVCYVYGYPENVKFWFNFGQYKSSIKLTSDQELSFEVTTFDNGIRSLKYIESSLELEHNSKIEEVVVIQGENENWKVEEYKFIRYGDLVQFGE